MFLPSWHVLRFPACRTSFCWLLLNREAENSEAASVTRAPCGSPDMKSNEDSRRCWRRRRRRPVQSLSITHDASDCLRFIWRWIVSLLKQLRWNLVCSFSHSVRSDSSWMILCQHPSLLIKICGKDKVRGGFHHHLFCLSENKWDWLNTEAVFLPSPYWKISFTSVLLCVEAQD